jgi:hypothetical protein
MKNFYALLIILFSVAFFKAQVNLITTAPSASLSNGTTGLRAPNGTSGHTSLRACYFVPSSEIAATLQGTVSSFGFVLTATLCNQPANGTITVYLQNTSATSYTLGNSWSTATVGMTQVFSGVYNLPTGTGPTVVDFQFPSNFAYTGGGLNLAYEYVGGQFASGNAVYSAFTNSAINCGATNISSTMPAVNTLSTTTFRPLFRFGTPNSYTNEAAIQIINAPGKVSQQAGIQHTISVTVFNGSNQTLNNIPVDLSILGSNPYNSTVTIASLAAGASTNVAFPAYNPTVLGISQINATIPNDQINTNNSAMFTQSTTCDVIATGPASFAPTTYSLLCVGFNSGAGGCIYSKFSTSSTQTLISVDLAISNFTNNVGKSICAIVSNSMGVVLATSNTLVIASADIDKFYTFNFSPVTFSAGVLYYVGMAQMAGPASLPLGATAAPNAPSFYVTQSLTGGALSPLNSNFGYFGIEPRFMSPCNGVGIFEVENDGIISMVLQPNPAKEKVLIHVNNSDGNMKLAIRNMLGQTVLEKNNIEEMNEINISGMKSGIYFVTLTKEKIQVTQKLIIE